MITIKHIYNKVYAGLVCCGMAAALTACSDDADKLPSVTAAECPTAIQLVIPDNLQQYIYTDGTGAAVLPLVKGETAQLGVTLEPETVTFPDVVWTSSATDVATVADGLITAVSGNGLGYSVINVTPVGMYSGADVNATLKVKVDEVLIPADAIYLKTDAATVTQDGQEYPSVFQGESITLQNEIEPEIATYRTCKWTSSDERIATVENGVVTAVRDESVTGRRMVTITAESFDGSGAKASIDIVVRAIVDPTSVTIDPQFGKDNYACAYYDRTVTLGFTTYPEDCTTSKIEWTSSNEEIATVSGGVVTFNRNGVFGDFDITATCPNGQSSTITMSLPAGYMRELFQNENNITWQATTDGQWTWSEGFITVTTPSSGYGRQDLKHNGPIYICTYNYPLYAIKIDDVLDQGYKSRSFKFDLNGADTKGNTYSGMGSPNNAYDHDYKLSDGSHVFIYDFVNGRYKIPAEPTNVFTSTVQGIKYADIKAADGNNPTSAVTYKMYWAQSFKSMEELEAYLTAEGLTWEVKK